MDGADLIDVNYPCSFVLTVLKSVSGRHSYISALNDDLIRLERQAA